MPEITINISTLNIDFTPSHHEYVMGIDTSSTNEDYAVAVSEPLTPEPSNEAAADETHTLANEITRQYVPGLEKFFDIVCNQHKVLEAKNLVFTDDYLDRLQKNLDNFKEFTRKAEEGHAIFDTDAEYDANMAAANLAIYAALQLVKLGSIQV